MADLLFLIPLLPLVAFVINIFWGRSTIRGNAHWIAIPAALGSWILVAGTAYAGILLLHL